jgi:queuine/archaeosine tRNA-ribosyltransferase
MLGPMLVSLHNIRFYQRLMADVRQALRDGTFEAFRRTDPRCQLGPAKGAADATNHSGGKIAEASSE